MRVYVREDIEYAVNTYQVGGTKETLVNIKGKNLGFNKKLIGKVCNVLHEEGSNYFVGYDGMNQYVPKECVAFYIEARKTGENSGFCREYFRNVQTGRLYAHQEDFKGVYKWYTCSKDGEPDSHFKDNIIIKDIETNKIYRVWRNE